MQALSSETTMNNNTYDNSYLKSSSKTSSSEFVNDRPRVINYEPQCGTENSTLTVVLEQAIADNSLSEVPPMKVCFGSLVVETKQHEQRNPTAASGVDLNNRLVWTTLIAQVPKLQDTRSPAAEDVMLSICYYDPRNLDEVIEVKEFGTFTYKTSSMNRDHKRQASPSLTDDLPSKKANTSLEDDPIFTQLIATPFDSPGKTTSSDHTSQSELNHNDAQPQIEFIPITSNNNNNNYNMMNFTSQAAAASSTSTTSSIYDQHANLMNAFNYNQQAIYSYPGFSTPHHPMSDHHSDTNSMYNNHNNYYTTQYHHQPLQPNLMMPTASSSSSMLPTMHRNNSNDDQAFAGVLSKAILTINGCLNAMTVDWSNDELSTCRRLVKFWRKQHENNQVECGFEPITPETYQLLRQQDHLTDNTKKKNGPLVVSCIYWHARNEFVITSVDCIYLLEGLLNVEFTVEEKNRIRRNLEGFKPLTVSKCKPESADFFKLIMAFPFPKPRNIEKDVKVFPWAVLPNALKKIIRKYTPSYSSTAHVHRN